jgi:hypothetical protein
MSTYQIYEFDGVELPLYEPSQDLSPGVVDSTLLASVGGAFDVWSGLQRLPKVTKIAIAGMYEGAEGSLYLVDHEGSYLVDHEANRIMVATGAAHLRQQVDNLRGKLGVAGSLRRRRWDDTTVTQWKTARLLQIQQKAEPKYRTTIAAIDCVFESAMANWRTSALDTVSKTLTAGGTVGLVLSSDGNATIDDSIVTVTATGGSITDITFAVASLGVQFRWIGTLADGNTLEVNCGAQTVQKTTGAAYAGFSLGVSHTARGWLPLPVGEHQALVTSNGPGTVAVSHYDQWV